MKCFVCKKQKEEPAKIQVGVVSGGSVLYGTSCEECSKDTKNMENPSLVFKQIL